MVTVTDPYTGLIILGVGYCLNYLIPTIMLTTTMVAIIKGVITLAVRHNYDSNDHNQKT